MSDNDPRQISAEAAQAAIAFGPPDFEINTAHDLDRYLDYLFSLMSAVEVLLDKGHFNLAAFTAITAIEETSRAHLSVFRRPDAIRKKGRDPLRDHAEKQTAAMGVVFMGSRMHDILGGEDAAYEFHKRINDGYLNDVRERSLYCFPEGDTFARPIDAIDSKTAWIIALVAIETVDDTFCGITTYSYQVSEKFDDMFERLRSLAPPG